MDEGTETAGGGEEERKALDTVSAAVAENVRDERRLLRLIGELRAGRAEGHTWRDLLAREGQPGVLDLTGRILRRITEASGKLRRTLAHGLRSEGATIPSIATLFGVTHQRVSALLRRVGRHTPA